MDAVRGTRVLLVKEARVVANLLRDKFPQLFEFNTGGLDLKRLRKFAC